MKIIKTVGSGQLTLLIEYYNRYCILDIYTKYQYFISRLLHHYFTLYFSIAKEEEEKKNKILENNYNLDFYIVALLQNLK